jgi:Svf1-like C-terminal lipocalin-like domain/Svf1-like N-terminal lipocalin domain
LWKSITVNNWVTPPPGQDNRSCKSDAFSIVHQSTSSDPTHSENYTITAKVSSELSISLNVSRPNSVSGFKVGNAPTGGFTYFGTNKEKPDGYVVHRFWPRTKGVGRLIFGSGGSAQGGGSRIEEISGVGMMVHAIQGMRPNLIARSWNFCWFTGKLPASDEHNTAADTGVSGIMMEFITTESYGRKQGGDGGTAVNVGCVNIGNTVVVTAETQWADAGGAINTPVISRATHYDAIMDRETGYAQPQKLAFSWLGPVPGTPAEVVKASLSMDVGFGETSNGLIEKVDVLSEIPAVLKTIVNAMGTKPYIYQVRARFSHSP